MKLYAIRDRLIDYFMQPFAAPGDKEVMSAVASQVNEGQHAIAQAPHQYEVWKLGEVDDEGHITPEREIICSCAQLIRGRIREGAEAEPREGANNGPTGRLREAPSGTEGQPGPQTGTATGTPPTAALP